MFSVECIGYFYFSIYLASFLEIFPNEYEVVLHFKEKREGKNGK